MARKLTREEFNALSVEVWTYVDDVDGKLYKGASTTYPGGNGCCFIDGYPAHTRNDIVKEHLLRNIEFYDLEDDNHEKQI